MRSVIKKNLFFILFFCSCIVAAQTKESHLAAENLRILQAQAHETTIDQYISTNMSGYNLTQDYIDEINANMTAGNEESQNLTQLQFLELLDLHKKQELRKLYFEQHQEIDSLFTALPLPIALQQNCFNGGFEDGFVNYTFRGLSRTSPSGQPGACETYPTYSALAPPALINQFNIPVTLVDNGLEPNLAALNPPVQLQRVMTGNRALKLNPTPENRSGNVENDGEIGNATKLSRVFLIDENQIQFSYLLLGKRASGHRPPEFNVRLFNNITNAEIPGVALCIQISASNPEVIQVNDSRPGWAGDEPFFYTPNWITRTINIPNTFIGTAVRIEFTVSDCLWRGHFGTVYLDNICGVICEDPPGAINITSSNISCPSETFNVCGTYQLPSANDALQSLSLTILDASNNQFGVQIPAPTILNTMDRTFCFSIDPTIFGSASAENFTFRVVAINDNICEARRTVIVTGGGVSFHNCCQPTLISALTFSTPVNEKRSQWINSADVFDGNAAIGIYHANDYLELVPGFETRNNAKFAAYIAECSEGFTYKVGTVQEDNLEQDDYALNIGYGNQINLTKIKNNFSIFPNPSNTSITISYTKQLQKITVFSMDGKMILSRETEDNTSQIDVSAFINGLYLITVETQNGQLLQSKFIKN